MEKDHAFDPGGPPLRRQIPQMKNGGAGVRVLITEPCSPTAEVREKGRRCDFIALGDRHIVLTQRIHDEAHELNRVKGIERLDGMRSQKISEEAFEGTGFFNLCRQGKRHVPHLRHGFTIFSDVPLLIGEESRGGFQQLFEFVFER